MISHNHIFELLNQSPANRRGFFILTQFLKDCQDILSVGVLIFHLVRHVDDEKMCKNYGA